MTRIVSVLAEGRADVREVVAGTRTDPVLSAHLKDGWQVVKPIHGYLQHDVESANWAAVIFATTVAVETTAAA